MSSDDLHIQAEKPHTTPITGCHDRSQGAVGEMQCAQGDATTCKTADKDEDDEEWRSSGSLECHPHKGHPKREASPHW